MFEQQPTTIMEELVPGLVCFGFLGLTLIVLVRFGILSSDVLIAYFGPGFLVAGLVVPTGIHSTWSGVYVVMGLLFSFGFWWLMIRFAGRVINVIFVRKL